MASIHLTKRRPRCNYYPDMTTDFHLEKWHPERKGHGRNFGANAHWRSTFVYHGGSDLNQILDARRSAIAEANKFGPGWRVTRVETEIIHTNEPKTS